MVQINAVEITVTNNLLVRSEGGTLVERTKKRETGISIYLVYLSLAQMNDNV